MKELKVKLMLMMNFLQNIVKINNKEEFYMDEVERQLWFVQGILLKRLDFEILKLIYEKYSELGLVPRHYLYPQFFKTKYSKYNLTESQYIRVVLKMFKNKQIVRKSSH